METPHGSGAFMKQRSYFIEYTFTKGNAFCGFACYPLILLLDEHMRIDAKDENDNRSVFHRNVSILDKRSDKDSLEKWW